MLVRVYPQVCHACRPVNLPRRLFSVSRAKLLQHAELPSQTEDARSHLSKSLSSRMDQLQTSILFAGKRLNDLTGYSGIEKLKNQIEDKESDVATCLKKVKQAKKAYEEAIRARSESQREVNELLQRKHTWTPGDLERFTTLFRNDHSAAQEETITQQALTDAEVRAESAREALTSMILARYHEEQIWSDKIRRASTWGTWGLMGFNVLLFVLVQLGLEPWKRKRLVGSFEEKVRQVVQEERLASQDNSSSSGSSSDDIFYTDADHAAAPFDHKTNSNRLGFETASSEIPGQAQVSENDAQELIPGIDKPVSHEEQMHGRPLVGTSSLLSMPLSLYNFHVYFAAWTTQFAAMAKDSSSFFLRQCQRLLSDKQCGLRVEEVTSACFASGLVGVFIGMLIRY